MRPDQDSRLPEMGAGSATCDKCFLELYPGGDDSICKDCGLNLMNKGDDASEQFLKDSMDQEFSLPISECILRREKMNK